MFDTTSQVVVLNVFDLQGSLEERAPCAVEKLKVEEECLLEMNFTTTAILIFL